MKSGQDQLELARIPVDVADGENARHAGLEVFGIYRDIFIVLQLEAPIGDRTELHRQAEERQHQIAVDVRHGAVGLFDNGFLQNAVATDKRGNLADDQINFSFIDQRHHLVDAVRRGAEVVAPMT